MDLRRRRYPPNTNRANASERNAMQIPVLIEPVAKNGFRGKASERGWAWS
jgi:hypothetical protein